MAQTVTYFHNDVSGTPLVATDASGAVVWKESYRPYGSKWNNAPGSNANAIGYAGRPHDASTGLSYMGARYYDPVLSRFMAIDPVSPQPDELHSLNRYAYANNNPYRFVDPDGRQAARIVFRAGIFVVGGIYYAFQPPEKKQEMVASLQRALDSIAKSESGDDSQANPDAGAKSGDGSLPKPPRGPGSVPKDERDSQRYFDQDAREKKRAEQDNKCANGCGTTIDGSNSAGHHKIRHADGGRTTPENHAEVCVDCHKDLHGR